MTTLSKLTENRWVSANRHRLNLQQLIPYLFIAPFFIVFIAFILGPTLFAFYASFHDWHLLGGMSYVGLKNFNNLFRDATLLKAVGNTLFYIVAGLVLQYPLSLLLATILNQPSIRLKRFFSTVYFIPVLTSAVVVAIVFTLLLDKSYGLFNAPLIAANIKPINWLGTRELSKFAVVMLIMWRWVGYNMVYFQAGMSAISRDLYEAAWVDGAGRFQTFFNITLPLMRPTIAYIIILGLIGGWQLFDEPYILTNGGPADSSLSVGNYLYRISIENLRMGYGSALGLVLFVAVFLITLFQLRFFGIFSNEESRE